MKNNKKYISLLLLFLFIFTNFTIVNRKVSASSNIPGEIILNKYRSLYELSGGESTEVTLEVNTNEVDAKIKKDVVIAIDVSNSMLGYLINEKTLLESTTDAAKNLVSTIINEESDSRVALVRYGTYASVYNFNIKKWITLDSEESVENLSYEDTYTNSELDFNNGISDIGSYSMGYTKETEEEGWIEEEEGGATNTEGGLIVTSLIVDKHKNKSYTVFMSDGVPTGRQIGTEGEPSGLYGVTYDESGSETSLQEKEEAINVANKLKNTSEVYAIGITVGLSQSKKEISDEVMKNVAEEGKYFETANRPVDMGDIYQKIGSSIVDIIAKKGLVTDIVPIYFTVSNLSKDITSKVLNDGSTKLTWNIGDIKEGNINTTYKLTLKPGYYGIIDLNKSAILTYDDHILGEKDPNKIENKTFPVPEIKALPIASDDEYIVNSNNENFVVNIENSILKNDINVKIDNSPYDERVGESNTLINDRNVQDYEMEITEGLDGNDGEIQDINISKGTFKFIPNPKRKVDEGKDTYTVYFKYRLVSKDERKAYKSNVAIVKFTVKVINIPDFLVTKTSNITKGKVGDIITYTITVKNTGDIGLSNIVLEDNMINFKENIELLDVGSLKIYTKEYKIPEGTKEGDLINQVWGKTIYDNIEIIREAYAKVEISGNIIEIEEEPVPIGPEILPKTGGNPISLYLSYGILSILIGLILIKKVKF